jgi:hypothetical protein
MVILKISLRSKLTPNKKEGWGINTKYKILTIISAVDGGRFLALALGMVKCL